MYKNFLKIITFLSILVSPFLYTSAYAKTKVGFVYLTTPGDHGCLLYTSPSPRDED